MSVVGISLLHTYKGSKLMESLFFGRGKRSIHVYVLTVTRNQNGVACSCSALFFSTLHSYDLQSGNGTIFHHHLLVLLVVQELVCVFAEEKTQVRVTRKYMASLMTSLKRDGFSLTLLKASPFWEKCLGE